MRDIFLFDLDGTLTDSGPGIMNSVRHALRHFGIEEEDRARLQRFVGPPLKESFMKFYGFSETQGEEAVEAYREYSKFEKCSKCELLAFCRGCPAVASGKDGNFYAADPQCWKEVSA